MNRVILVTGTRKGIGESIARNFLAQGDFVIGCSRGEIATDSELATADRYTHFRADVSNEVEVSKIFQYIREKFGRLDALVNNAGIASMNHSLLTSIETVQKVFATNSIGTFLFCRESAKIMRKKKFGRIVNFSTVATPLKLEGESIYAASKAAIVSLTQTLAKEFAPLGITVNAIGPTPIQTDLIRGVSTEKLESLLARQAIHRFGTIEDVQNVLEFFLRRESDFITGQTIYLGGV